MNNGRIVSIAATVLLFAVFYRLSIPNISYAAQVTTVVTGTVDSGGISSGATRDLFGYPPGTNLSTMNFTAKARRGLLRWQRRR
jgi:hypothetical protein